MAEYNNIVSPGSYGLNTDNDPLDCKPGDYRYMLNGCLSSIEGISQHARMFKGNRLSGVLSPGFYFLAAVNFMGEYSCIFSVNPSTGEGEIGRFDGVAYTPITSSIDLQFSINSQIQAVVDRDYNGKHTVIWVEVDAPVRYMDLNNPPMLNGALDVDALNVFRKYTYPTLEVTEITNNGRITACALYLTLQYADENGNGLTAWTTPVGPVFIYRDSLKQQKAFVNGSTENELTGKAVRLLLTNLDKSFKYVNVGVIKSKGGIRSGVIASTVPTSQNHYLYTGNVDTERDVDIKEMLTPGVSYASAKTISICNGVVQIGNLKAKKEFNFQPYISRIGVQWQVKKEKYDSAEASYANPLKALYELQYRRNEVYGFGLVIRWDDGTKSRMYPFVGRKIDKTSTGVTITRTFDQYGRTIPSGSWDSAPSDSNDDLIEVGTALPPRWKTGSTAYQLGNDLPSPTGFGPAMYGELGYYESEDTYPVDASVWGSDAGQPIRLFRMPDHTVAPIIDGENAFRHDADIVSIYKLGIRFPNIETVIASLPPDIKDHMQGWELVRYDRRNQRSVIASGIIHNMFYQNWANTSREDFSRNIFGIPADFDMVSRGEDVRLYQNYPHNDLRPDQNIRRVGSGDNVNGGENNDQYRKDVFSFTSPDTSFEKNLLSASEMLIHKELYGVCKEDKEFLDPYPLLKDKGSDKDQVAYQTTSVGYYYNWKKNLPGTLRREVKEAMYIPFNAQVGSGAVTLPIDNTLRNSTVLVFTGKDIADPTVVDNSRAYAGDPDFACKMQKGKYRSISAHYVSLINRLPNQYGSVFDARGLFTNMDSNNIRNNKIVFGGDSYIAPFTVKRQLVFFRNAQAYMNVDDGPDAADLRTTEVINNTRYYYLSARRNANKDSNTECKSTGGFLGIGSDMGFVPVIYTGLPVVFCESDYNIDLRINGQLQHETFYPNLMDGAQKVSKFAGIENIDKDNYSVLNASYSEQNDLSAYQGPDPFFNPLIDDSTHYATRVIHSLKGSPENRFNNLLVYLPLNYYDFGRDCGELNNIADLGNYRTMYQFAHACYLGRIYNGLETDATKIIIGNGTLFSQEPERMVTASGGYAGCNSQWAVTSTPFGTFFPDTERGAVFQFADSLHEISMNGMEAWFARNLPFSIVKDIPFFTKIDNPANPEGVGLSSVWDPVLKLWILTKIDYELIDPINRAFFSLDEDGNLRFNGGPVSLQNAQLFRSRGWTISYNPVSGRWNGEHSFLSGGYFTYGSTFYSLSGNTIWGHDNPVPRTYYGTRYPFVFEGVLKSESGAEDLHTLNWLAKSYPINASGVAAGESRSETFTKGYVYNSRQCSGLLHFVYRDPLRRDLLLFSLAASSSFKEALLTYNNHIWGIGTIYDRVQDHSQPIFVDGELAHNNIDYIRDARSSGRLNDLWHCFRLIYDKDVDIQLYYYFGKALSEEVVK
jgi:hypothetical protein